MISKSFLHEFKAQTESKWANLEIARHVYGFQFQKGTQWNPGLTEAEINHYEQAVRADFPLDFRLMLSVMNGTDLQTINVYGYSGEPIRYGLGVYSYPRDIEIVREMISLLEKDSKELSGVLEIDFPANDKLVPIYGHRYVVCGTARDQSPVVSIMGLDAIYYGDSLENYLISEFLRQG